MENNNTREKPKSDGMKLCNLPWIFPCMSKLTLERINEKLNRQMKKKKTERNWKIIQACILYWISYIKIVDIWLFSRNFSIINNGKQLFQFMLGVSPQNSIFNLIESIAGREKFMEDNLILLADSFFGLLKKYGEDKIYKMNSMMNTDQGKIDWDEEIEDENDLVDRINRKLGTQILLF